MANTNIYNPTTGQTGFQIPGASIPTGWVAGGATIAPPPVTPPQTADTTPTTAEKPPVPRLADNPNNRAYLAGLGYDPAEIDKTIKSSLQPSERTDLEVLGDDFQTKSKQVQDTILNIQNGTIPLNAGEQAQVEALKQQFQQLIDQQGLVNKGAEGTANIRGYQTGAAEYDPSFQVKTIGTIVTTGLNKIADLNIKMAGAVAELTSSLKDKNIAAVKDAWGIYQTAYKERKDALTKTIEESQKVMENARKEQYERVTKPIQDIDIELAKMGAPAAIRSAVINSKNVGEAISNAGDWLQTGTGIVGEYLFYKRQAEMARQVPMSFDDYQTVDANRKKSIAAAGLGGGGLSSKEATIFNSIVDKYNKSPLVAAKDRTVVLQGIIDQLRKNPSNGTAQLSLAYGYIQALDTYQSAVREGELGLVNSIDSKVGQVKNSVEKIQNGQIVRPEVAKEIANSAQLLVNSIAKGAENKQKSFMAQATQNGSNIESAFKDYTSTINGLDTNLVDQTTQLEDKIASSLSMIKTTNPKLYNAVVKLGTSINPQTKQPYSPQEILQAFPELNK